MATVDLYADFIGGRAVFDAENLKTLRSKVAANLGRNDINWSIYDVHVNDEPVSGDFMFQDGDVVKVISPKIKDLRTREEHHKSQREHEQLYEQRLEKRIEFLEVLYQGALPDNVLGPIRRPLLKPTLERPDFSMETFGKRYVGNFACRNCGGFLDRDEKNCLYCGAKINWATVDIIQ